MPELPELPELPEPRGGDEPRYDIPLHELTGRHAYARSLGDDEEPDPGAPVAYVAESVRDRPNMLTIEGMIVGIGNAAQSAAREGGTSVWVLYALLAAFVLPTVYLTLRQLTGLF